MGRRSAGAGGVQVAGRGGGCGEGAAGGKGEGRGDCWEGMGMPQVGVQIWEGGARVGKGASHTEI